MMNFLYGLAAGGLITGIATITAARNPEVQSRLGLIPPAQAALAPKPSHLDPGCRGPAKSANALDAAQNTAQDAKTDALFSRRRFWYVSPDR